MISDLISNLPVNGDLINIRAMGSYELIGSGRHGAVYRISPEYCLKVYLENILVDG